MARETQILPHLGNDEVIILKDGNNTTSWPSLYKIIKENCIMTFLYFIHHQ